MVLRFDMNHVVSHMIFEVLATFAFTSFTVSDGYGIKCKIKHYWTLRYMLVDMAT